MISTPEAQRIYFSTIEMQPVFSGSGTGCYLGYGLFRFLAFLVTFQFLSPSLVSPPEATLCSRVERVQDLGSNPEPCHLLVVEPQATYLNLWNSVSSFVNQGGLAEWDDFWGPSGSSSSILWSVCSGDRTKREKRIPICSVPFHTHPLKVLLGIWWGRPKLT